MDQFLNSINDDEIKSLVKSVIEQIGGWDNFKDRADDITRNGANGIDFLV